MNRAEFTADVSRSRIIRALLYGIIFAVGGCTVVLLIAAAVISHNDVPQSAVNIVADAAVVLSSFMAGFAAARVLKSRGLISGALMGLVYYLLLLLVSVLFFKAQLTPAALTKLVMTVSSAAIGGVAGVNMRLKRRI